MEKLHIVHTQVALLTGAGSGRGVLGPSERGAGEPLPLREGTGANAEDLDWREERLLTFGTNVILADDLRKPALSVSAQPRPMRKTTAVYIKLITFNRFQVQCDRVLSGFGLVHIAYPM